MEDNTFEQGETYAIAAAKWRARRAAAMTNPRVQVTVEQLPDQQPLRYRVEQPIQFQSLPVQPRIAVQPRIPVPARQHPPIKPPPVILPLPPRRRPEARVGPTRYLYVPGLARDALVVTPCADTTAFLARIENIFGYRKKWIRRGEEMENEFRHDEFMTGAVPHCWWTRDYR